MAGDWIKMRVDLADDPAVIAIAAATDLDEDSVVGKLHRLWSWADRQSRDGHASGVTTAWLNRYIRCDGFAESMLKYGWLVVEKGGVSFPNFDRHNGKTAKTRALATDRKATQRSRNKRDEGGTREEKKREEEILDTPPQEGGGERLGVRLPPHWSPPADLVEWANQERPDLIGDALLKTTMNFRDHYRSTGDRREDWNAAWQKWIRRESRAPPAKASGGAKSDERAQWAKELTGGGNGQRTIDGTAERVG